MIVPITSYQQVYVAACGMTLENEKIGRDHERLCWMCRRELGVADDAEREDPPQNVAGDE